MKRSMREIPVTISALSIGIFVTPRSNEIGRACFCTHCLDAEGGGSSDQSCDQSGKKGDDKCCIKRIHDVFVLKKL